MLVGTTILKMGATEFRSPQFPRGGLSAVFTLEATHEVGTATMSAAIEHRNADDTTWAVAGTFGAITAPGVYSLDVTAIMEIVRITYTLTGADLTGFHVIVGAPSWRPY
jgi:hypothetical protein